MLLWIEGEKCKCKNIAMDSRETNSGWWTKIHTSTVSDWIWKNKVISIYVPNDNKTNLYDKIFLIASWGRYPNP